MAHFPKLEQEAVPWKDCRTADLGRNRRIGVFVSGKKFGVTKAIGSVDWEEFRLLFVDLLQNEKAKKKAA
jgi:hypothetical protein